MIFELLDTIKNAGCTIKEHFHIYCPSCGGTRAIEALLKMQIWESILYNPVVILFILDLIIMLIVNVIEKLYPPRKYYKTKIIVNSAFLISVLVFFLYRNYLLLYKGIDLLGDFS